MYSSNPLCNKGVKYKIIFFVKCCPLIKGFRYFCPLLISFSKKTLFHPVLGEVSAIAHTVKLGWHRKVPLCGHCHQVSKCNFLSFCPLISKFCLPICLVTIRKESFPNRPALFPSVSRIKDNRAILSLNRL